MLVEKKPTPLSPDIRTYKLLTGEEIIAEVTNPGRSAVTLKRPLLMVLAEMPGNPEQTQVVFTPWMMALDETQTVDVNYSAIIASAPARKDARDQYVAATRP